APGLGLYAGAADRHRARIERPARPRREIERIGHTESQALEPGPTDHRAIVGAEPGRRGDESEPAFAGERLEAAAQRRIGGNATRHHERFAHGAARFEDG